jgi:putative transposase
MKITLKTKLTVSPEQHRVLDRMAFSCTKLWNTANWERRLAWDETGKIPGYADQCRALKGNPWYRRMQSHASQAVLQKLDHSYRSWYRLRKTDLAARPPGFRPKEVISTITFKEGGFKVEGNTIRLSLSKNLRDELGYSGQFLVLPFQSHKPPEGTPKIVEVMYSGGSWYAHIVQEVVVPEPLPETKVMAMDLGIVNLAACVTEDGTSEIIDGGQLSSVWRYFTKQIGKVQGRVMARGKRWNKGLGALSRKRTRQVKHILHTASKQTIASAVDRQVSTIIVGDLGGIRKDEAGKGRNLGRNNQKLHAWSFHQFTQMLVYKGARAGISVKLVSERNSSKTCSVCGTVDKTSRVHRGLYRCKTCGTEMNADINGARNILKTYLESRGTGRPVVAPLAVPTVRRWNAHAFC